MKWWSDGEQDKPAGPVVRPFLRGAHPETELSRHQIHEDVPAIPSAEESLSSYSEATSRPAQIFGARNLFRCFKPMPPIPQGQHAPLNVGWDTVIVSAGNVTIHVRLE